MAQKTLNAFVVISGRVDNSFGQIGTALINMGQTVDQISQKLINFGKESIDVYREYQDSMLDAEVALSTIYGRGSRELAGVMKTLDAQATEWAASTIFHTDDVANAIAQAAHANWDLDMILTGIPNAMRLAQAGSMDLSEAVDLIIKSVNAAGLEFGDLTDWIDEWTYAANSSAGDVAQFGAAMLKMGNTMKFAKNKEELLTLLAVLHDSGTTGEAAGTLLRNTMLRLIAPTEKASKAMKKMGISQSEMDEAMADMDEDTAAAYAQLEKFGFTVYDSSGDLKGFLEIFRDLDIATRDMSDKDRYAIWSSIFPAKTIAGGAAEIEGAIDAITTLYAELEEGKAEGYGEFAAETMMSGLTGAIETFTSKVERLKENTGKALEGDVTYWTEELGGFVDKISTLDNAKFQGLVGGLEVIAAAGPGLIIAGTGFRFLGWALGTNTGKIALAALAIAALGKAMDDYSEAKFEEKFGDMQLDMEPIQAHLNEITQPFEEARAELDAYVTAMNTAVDAYTNKSSELASGIISGMVTKKEYTQDEIKAFTDMGDEIGGYIIDGITNAYDAVSESFTLVNGGIDEAATDPMWASFMGMLEVGYGQAIAKAKTLSTELRAALMEGFADGHLTSDEAEKIQSILNEMNELLAMQTSAENYAESQRLMRRAQTLGLDGLEELTTEVNETRDAKIDALMYDRDLAHSLMENYLNAHIGEYYGDDFITPKYIEQTLAGIDSKYDSAIDAIRDIYNGIILSAWENAMSTSDLAGADEFLTGIAQGSLWGGMTQDEIIAARNAYQRENEQFSLFEKPGTAQAVDYYQMEVNALGGNEAVIDLLKYYLEQKDVDNAQTYAELLSKAGYLGAESIRQMYTDAGVAMPVTDKPISTGKQEEYNDPNLVSWTEQHHVAVEEPVVGTLLDNNGQPVTSGAEAAQEPAQPLIPSPEDVSQWYQERTAQDTLSPAENNWNSRPQWSKDLGNWVYGLFNGGAGEAESDLVPLSIEGAEEAAISAFNEAQAALDAQGDLTLGMEVSAQESGATSLPSPDEVSQWYETRNTPDFTEFAPEESVKVNVDGDTSELVATIDAADALTLMEYVNGDATNLYAVIERADGQSILVSVKGDTSDLRNALASIKDEYAGQAIRVRVTGSGTGLNGYASGGRATEPSIYAEAGPEWFIPERHDANTAGLIAAAAHASGFSLAELAAMGGASMFADGGSIGGSAAPNLETLAWDEMDYSSAEGSGSSGSGNTYDVNYAPVIHAENAEGVERVLSEDKKRLKKLLKELEEERELLGSVVSYG